MESAARAARLCGLRGRDRQGLGVGVVRAGDATSTRRRRSSIRSVLDRNANVRQIHGREGEVWTPESAADKLRAAGQLHAPRARHDFQDTHDQSQSHRSPQGLPRPRARQGLSAAQVQVAQGQGERGRMGGARRLRLRVPPGAHLRHGRHRLQPHLGAHPRHRVVPAQPDGPDLRRDLRLVADQGRPRRATSCGSRSSRRGSATSSTPRATSSTARSTRRSPTSTASSTRTRSPAWRFGR